MTMVAPYRCGHRPNTPELWEVYGTDDETILYFDSEEIAEEVVFQLNRAVISALLEAAKGPERDRT